MKLFDAINAQAEYDEEKLLKKFAKDPIGKSFAVTKNYLLDAIFAALRQYHSGKLYDDVSYERLQNLRLLNEKGLFAACEKQLLKLKEFCTEYELFVRQLEVLAFETGFNNTLTSSNAHTLPEREEALQRLTHCLKLDKLYTTLIDTATNHDYMLSPAEWIEVDALMQNEILKNESALTSNSEQYIFWNIHFVYHYLKRDYRQSYFAKRKQFEISTRDETILKTKPKAYLLMTGNLIALAYNLNNPQEYERCYADLLHAHEIVKGAEELKFEQYAAFTLLLFKVKKDYSRLNELAEYIEEKLNQYAGKINIVRELDTYFNVAVSFFRVSEFETALVWLNKLLNHPRIEEREQRHRIGKILELILHFELKNFELLQYKIVNTYRHLYKRNKLEEADRLMMNGFKQVIKAHDKLSTKASLQKLRDSLLEISKTEYNKVALEQFDYTPG